MSDHFTWKELFRFVLPSIFMMIFTSIYGVVDGFFVSSMGGKTAFAAINLIMPVPMGLGAIGFMFGSGGSALVSQTLGAGKRERANQIFTMLVAVCFSLGVLIAVFGCIFMEKIALLLKADEAMLPYAVVYGRILTAVLPTFMLQFFFQGFMVTAEKPKLGLLITILSGVTNMVGDLLLVGLLGRIFSFGPMQTVIMAAVATALSQAVGSIPPLIYFFRKNTSLLRFCPFRLEGKPLLKVCFNGSSELVVNLSMSLVNMLYNVQLMKFVGENGVAAYGTLMYVNFIFVSVFVGYSVGSAPIVGYHYGAQNSAELKNILKKSLLFLLVAGVVMTLAANLLSSPLAVMFSSKNEELYLLTKHAFLLYSFSFLVTGFNIYSSSFFTALGNGLVSAIISLARTLVFQLACIYLLPVFWGLDGIWLSVLFSEVLSLILSAAFLFTNRKKYGY